MACRVDKESERMRKGCLDGGCGRSKTVSKQKKMAA